MFQNLYALGALSDAALDKVAAENDKLLAAVKNPETYKRENAVAAFDRLAALAKK